MQYTFCVVWFFVIFNFHNAFIFLLTPKTWLELLHCCTFPKSFCSPHLCLQKITCTENSLENTMNIHSSLLNKNFCFSVSVCSALRCSTVKMHPPSSDQLQFKCRRRCTKIHFTLPPTTTIVKLQLADESFFVSRTYEAWRWGSVESGTCSRVFSAAFVLGESAKFDMSA